MYTQATLFEPRQPVDTRIQVREPALPYLAGEGETLTITGEVTTIRYHDPASGFFVASLRRNSDEIAVVGSTIFLAAGAHVTVSGQWVDHARYGRQFKASSIALTDQASAMQTLLGSGFLKGVKTKMAQQIARTFGPDTFARLDQAIDEPDRLRVVKGIGPVNCRWIVESWQAQRHWAQAALVSVRAGLTMRQAKEAHRRFGDELPALLSDNPYLLTVVHGVTWKRADEIASMEWPGKQKIGHDDARRYAAAVREVLRQAYTEGHMALTEGDALARAKELAKPTLDGFDDKVRSRYAQEYLLLQGEWLYMLPYYEIERDTAEAIVRMLARPAEPVGDWQEISANLDGYSPFPLSSDQVQAVQAALASRVLVITGNPGTGKAQPLSAQLLTPYGWVRMGDVKVGNVLLVPDGSSTIVVGVYPQGELPVWEVEFEDGRIVECCGDHLWRVWRNRGWATLTTRAIADVFANQSNEYKRTAVPMIAANLPYQERWLNIPPYILGVLLAEGHAHGSSITLTTDDQGVVDRIASLLPDNMHIIKATGPFNYLITLKIGGQSSPYRQELKRCGLLGKRCYEKFIPEYYKDAGLEQRYELLRGLMDGDGHVDIHGVMSYTTTSEQLARDVQELVWSLGGLATISSRHTSYTHNGEKRTGRLAYKVSIRHGNGRLLVALDRKRERINPNAQYKWDRVKIKAVRETGRSVPMQCIQVDHPDQLYVTDNYIVTHNTTILQTICNIMAEHGLSLTLCAPTGKAARRMAEATDRDAATIHRTLGIFGDGEGQYRFQTDVVILDETSMVDASLMRQVVTACSERTRLIFIGDVDQLPPVGAGEPFYQIIQSGVPVVRLVNIHRQGKNSGIVWAAHGFNAGVVADVTPFEDIEISYVASNAALPDAMLKKVGELVRAGLSIRDVQVLTPLNQHPWGQHALNLRLQQVYNPGPFPLKGCPFKPGDKVIHTKNVYDMREQTVLNGMTGLVRWVATDEEERWLDTRRKEAGDDELPVILRVRFDGESEDTTYTREELGFLKLAYAMSVHKSQGSGFSHVVLALPTTFPGFMLRQLAYTGLTRAKQYCAIISAQSALQTYVQNEARVRRVTFLGEIIRNRVACVQR